VKKMKNENPRLDNLPNAMGSARRKVAIETSSVEKINLEKPFMGFAIREKNPIETADGFC
jgi:hypothetical protein